MAMVALHNHYIRWMIDCVNGETHVRYALVKLRTIKKWITVAGRFLPEVGAPGSGHVT